MTLKLRMTLLCAVSIFVCGLLGSYKSFQIFQTHNEKTQVNKSYEVSTWVAQNVEQRLQQVESAVSYLDKSTVETLKRFGARYFAYAFKKKDDWTIKWKVLGEVGKDQILSEVNGIDFDKVSHERRSWVEAANKELIFISPVELADSHQLKNGFLVFGFKKDFFAFLGPVDGAVSLLSREALPLHNRLPSSIQESEALFSSESGVIGRANGEVKGENRLFTSYFSHLAQAWVVNSQPVIVASFFETAFFTYFLLATLLSLMLFVIALNFAVRDGVVGSLPRLRIPDMKFKKPDLSAFRRKEKAESAGLNQIEMEVVEDFEELLDDILEEEMDRLNKVGVQIKTQVEEGARVLCSPQHISDFIKRLIGNSVLTLEHEAEKGIQIQLVEQKDSWQLIYVDTRTSHFPSGEEPSLLLQTEGSLEGIDGIISYASWLFGEGLTVARKGFCLSVDLKKPVAMVAVTSEEGTEIQPVAVEPLTPQLERIEILDEDTDGELMQHFDFASLEQDSDEEMQTLEMEGLGILGEDSVADDSEEPKVSFDDVIDQFRMKDFNFNNLKPEIAPAAEGPEGQETEEEEVQTDDRGLFEFDSGQIKIKIRSPKKRGQDADR